MNIIEVKTLYEAKFLRMIEVTYIDHRGGTKKWEGVERINATTAVHIPTLTPDLNLVMIRQPRILAGGELIEFPAGLLDIPGETLLQAANRELLEETGYEGTECHVFIGGDRGLTVSSGLTSERHKKVLITGARKVAKEREDEGTKPFKKPLFETYAWLEDQVKLGFDVDYKMFGTVREIEWLVQNGFEHCRQG